MDELPRRTHRKVLEETLEFDGARVADIGCGDGALVRVMTRLGARASGIDPSEHHGRALAEATRALKPGGRFYIVEPIAPGAALYGHAAHRGRNRRARQGL